MTLPSDVTPAKSFRIWETIGQGWKIFCEHVWKFIGLQLLLLAFIILSTLLINAFFPVDLPEMPETATSTETPELAYPESETPWYTTLTNSVLSTIAGLIVSVGVINIAVKFADRVPVQYSDLWTKAGRIGKYFLASFLYGLMVFIGLIFLIVPGLFLAVRFGLYPYFVVDQGQGPIQALKSSWRTVKGASWRVFGFWLATWLITLLGIIALGFGLLAALPTVWTAAALVYRKLWNQTNA